MAARNSLDGLGATQYPMALHHCQMGRHAGLIPAKAERELWQTNRRANSDSRSRKGVGRLCTTVPSGNVRSLTEGRTFGGGATSGIQCSSGPQNCRKMATASCNCAAQNCTWSSLAPCGNSPTVGPGGKSDPGLRRNAQEVSGLRRSPARALRRRRSVAARFPAV